MHCGEPKQLYPRLYKIVEIKVTHDHLLRSTGGEDSGLKKHKQTASTFSPSSSVCLGESSKPSSNREPVVCTHWHFFPWRPLPLAFSPFFLLSLPSMTFGLSFLCPLTAPPSKRPLPAFLPHTWFWRSYCCCSMVATLSSKRQSCAYTCCKNTSCWEGSKRQPWTST